MLNNTDLILFNLKEYIRNNYSTSSEFAKVINITTSNLSNILNGKRKFSHKYIEKIEHELKLDSGYFLRKRPTKIPFLKLCCAHQSLEITHAYLDSDKPLLEISDYSNLYVLSYIELKKIANGINLKSGSNFILRELKTLQLIVDKIYLILYKNIFILRRLVNDGKLLVFISDDFNLYPNINIDDPDVKIHSILIANMTIIEV